MYDWKKEFYPKILERGRDYFETGKVRLKPVESPADAGDDEKTTQIEAEVSGTETYDISIEMNQHRIRRMRCSCPFAAEDGKACKHMAATLFKISSAGRLPFEREAAGSEDDLFAVLKDRLVSDGLVTEVAFTAAVSGWKEKYHVVLQEEPDESYETDEPEERDTPNAPYAPNHAVKWETSEDVMGKPEASDWEEGPAAVRGEREPREDDEDEKSLEELLSELDSLVGLENVKQDIHTMINFIKVNQLREARGLKTADISYHLVFSGNPGTGKTTVARLLAQLYRKIGVLSQGQLVEVDRSGLIAGYAGQTAIKTAEVIETAIGGVLFIDEAYSLVEGEDDGFGKECIATILKAMEDHRDELIVIVAGYDDLMHKFMDANPGMRSRFNKYFHFPDYTGEEMERIFLLQCRNNGYQLGPGVQDMLRAYFEKLYASRNLNFGNGRDVRNLFEKIINAQANRLATESDLTDEMLMTITAADVQAVLDGK